MLGTGRDLKRSSSPIPLMEQEHLDEATQECVQMGLECLQRRRLYNLSGHPVPVFCHPHCEEIPLKFKWNLLCSSLSTLPLFLPLVVTKKSLASSS